jgi:hypothetical protein
MNREKFVKQIQADSMHAMVVKRGDGLVGLFYTREPMNWLGILSQHALIEEAEVRPSAHSPRIVSFMRARFAHAHTPNEAFPWYLVDFQQAVDALNDFNHETGELLDLLKPDTPVLVLPERKRGTVIGFSRCGRVVVKLHSPHHISNLVLALRENVKPVVRAATISEPTG